MDGVARLKAESFPMAVQNIRQEFAHDIKPGSGYQRDPGVAGNIARALPAGWPPSTGDRTGAGNAGYAGDRKDSPAVGMPGNDSAQNRVAGPRPDPMFMRREIAVVFVKNHGGPVGDGLANSVVGKVAAKALPVGIPTLSPFRGDVSPLAHARADSLAQNGDWPTRAEQIQMEALLFRQLARLRRSDHAENFIQSSLVLRRGGGRRLCKNRHRRQSERKEQKDETHQPR